MYDYLEVFWHPDSIIVFHGIYLGMRIKYLVHIYYIIRIIYEDPLPLPIGNVEEPILYLMGGKAEISIFVDGLNGCPFIFYIISEHPDSPIIICKLPMASYLVNFLNLISILISRFEYLMRSVYFINSSPPFINFAMNFPHSSRNSFTSERFWLLSLSWTKV